MQVVHSDPNGRKMCSSTLNEARMWSKHHLSNLSCGFWSHLGNWPRMFLTVLHPQSNLCDWGALAEINACCPQLCPTWYHPAADCAGVLTHIFTQPVAAQSGETSDEPDELLPADKQTRDWERVKERKREREWVGVLLRAFKANTDIKIYNKFQYQLSLVLTPVFLDSSVSVRSANLDLHVCGVDMHTEERPQLYMHKKTPVLLFFAWYYYACDGYCSTEAA